jgi:hypothetical protein
VRYTQADLVFPTFQDVNMPRWNEKEQQYVHIIREKLSTKISESPQYPDLIGDRKIVRFLRGHNYDIDKILQLYRNFFIWRNANDVNEIRNSIIFGGMLFFLFLFESFSHTPSFSLSFLRFSIVFVGRDHPLRFPKGDIILPIIKQIVIAPDATDCYSSPLCIEQYNFSPSEILEKISLEDYVIFMIYCLEYRSLILEQLSEERETAFLASLSEEEREKVERNDSEVYYGVLANICVIRDLSKSYLFVNKCFVNSRGS